MSNIFYSGVDINLQAELNARGTSGYTRDTKDLQFMLEKVANVELIAYKNSVAIDTEQVGHLGGRDVVSGRYLPTGPDGFLNDSKTYDVNTITFDKITNRAIDNTNKLIDSSRRTGPFITSMDINIGDHSMGLLNKATVAISIPNPERDLDNIEDIWFRPGRYVRINIQHPDSAIITGGLLSADSLPNEEKLKKLYPNLITPEDRTNFTDRIRKLNLTSFEGLVTSFEFSYQPSGQVDATISLTGTSNTYTDVAMYLPGATPEEPTKPTRTSEVTIDPVIATTTPPAPPASKPSFFSALYTKVDNLIIQATGNSTPLTTGCIPYYPDNAKIRPTDQYIVFGERYASSGTVGSNTNFSRYITLGALIQFINDYPIQNITGSLPMASIICTDQSCLSNHYNYITSCTPDDILLLEKDTGVIAEERMNVYGTDVNDIPPTPILIYYKDLVNDTAKIATSKNLTDLKWPGVDEFRDELKTRVIYPSRILINLELIQDILLGAEDAITKQRTGGITSGGTRGFALKTFLSTISSKISYATGGAISMKLVTDPKQLDILYFKDSKFLRSEVKGKDAVTRETIQPYSVPMMANHPYGTIVKDFKLSATLPENAKNLSYVLNQDPSKISEYDIAPYMNFMYNAKNAAAINAMSDEYSRRHQNAIIELKKAKGEFGLSPKLAEKITALYKQLNVYLMFPTDKIKDSQQITAPIFPFSAEITIDGINGFKYGDVLTFEALPSKYRSNTVFSVINITHTVGSDGAWYTTLRCIMRPNIA